MFVIFGDVTNSFVGYGRFSVCLDNFTICNDQYEANFTSREWVFKYANMYLNAIPK